MCTVIYLDFNCGHEQYIFHNFCEDFMKRGKRCFSRLCEMPEDAIVKIEYRFDICGNCKVRRNAYIAARKAMASRLEK
ncbi:hypothetical protein SPBR_08954 [Sporothrix brasiliensis 5110]|uniref:Uncharacterized protein n=1 Tax=Sporothrix brasiliensis 5110 TaxID=1398154 RepID=A0A0C2IDX9_9PEZI|nr:uncharacterized protein SPBR_08954 [Sporothrix brasiliensis 5110]KIH87486.1 hypothetical protein SPBR_08954 [Sporothrix brasiliensis 5110]